MIMRLDNYYNMNEIILYSKKHMIYINNKILFIANQTIKNACNFYHHPQF